jgi:hypothetical protein
LVNLQTRRYFLKRQRFLQLFRYSKLQDQGVDSVVTLARRKPVSKKECLKELGNDGLIIEWPKPPYNKNLSYSRETWESLPSKLVMRQIKVTVTQPGLGLKKFNIVTTFLDPQKYNPNEIAELYLRRCKVELYFRDITNTMGFDIIRCRSSLIIRKEILMNFIA